MDDKNLFLVTEESSFEEMLDAACERLLEKHVQYSLRRINEMNDILIKLEREIDEFISGSPNPADKNIHYG